MSWNQIKKAAGFALLLIVAFYLWSPARFKKSNKSFSGNNSASGTGDAASANSRNQNSAASSLMNSSTSNANADSNSQNAFREKLLSQDREILKDDHAEFAQVASAMMRLATFRDPTGRAKALELIGAKDNKISAIAYRALGYYDEPDVNTKLSELLKSPDSSAQQGALDALTWNPTAGSGREEILKDHFDSTKKMQGSTYTSSPEAMRVIGALYRISKDDSAQNEYLAQITDVLKNSKNELSKRAAAQTYLQLAPKNAPARELAESALKTPIPHK